MKLALRIPQINRSWLMLGGALLLGGVALALSHKLLTDRMAQIDAETRAAHKMVKVVVANRDLARGEPVAADRFAVREVPAEFVHSAAVRPEGFGRYLGRRLVAPLKRGEPLLDVHMELGAATFSSTLQNGNRALTTEVDEVNSISGMLRPSDHIDLMVTAHGSGPSPIESTFALLSNVEVLATGQVTRKSEGSNQARTYTTITLSVSPADAQRIVVAKNSGKLTAVLRSPDDAQPNATEAMNIDDVIPKKTSSTRRVAVQYIIGGQS
jgi:pilus assembly protein CpaB